MGSGGREASDPMGRREYLATMPLLKSNKLAATEEAAVEAKADSKEALRARTTQQQRQAVATYGDRVQRLREALSDVGIFASDTITEANVGSGKACELASDETESGHGCCRSSSSLRKRSFATAIPLPPANTCFLAAAPRQ